jgi:hypothetical protein
MLTPTVPTATEQVTTLLTTFGLTTAAQEMVPRLTQAGHLARPGAGGGVRRRSRSAAPAADCAIAPRRSTMVNIYLHYVLDEWFEHEVKPRLRGVAAEIRYADDSHP